MKKGMLMRIAIIPVILCCCITMQVTAQSNIKEGQNAFARYTKSNAFAELEKARKFSDDSYKLKRDSLSYRNNLLRALVYSSLAVADSSRKLKYTRDPIDETLLALNRLKDDRLNYENEPEISYIRKRLSNAFLMKANRALADGKSAEAMGLYRSVDSLNVADDAEVAHNMAVLSEKLGKKEQAITYYREFVNDRQLSRPEYILRLANLYEEVGNKGEMRQVLLTGRDQFPKNKDILFQLINTYANAGAYDAVVTLVDEALIHEPENLNLNYLAGYAYEVTGNRSQAEKLYKKVIVLDANHFDANFELGLLYLRDFLEDPNNESKKLIAQEYLLKANEINPNAVNALKSLAVFYNRTGDLVQLERVNSKLNQISLY